MGRKRVKETKATERERVGQAKTGVKTDKGKTNYAAAELNCLRNNKPCTAVHVQTVKTRQFDKQISKTEMLIKKINKK